MMVQVFLVDAPNPPGAMTYIPRGGASACVLDVNVGGENYLLMETILHESCLTLDMASRRRDIAYAALPARLEERGLSRSDNAFHTVPHTLMFVQAE